VQTRQEDKTQKKTTEASGFLIVYTLYIISGSLCIIMEEIEIKCFYCQFICHSKNEWYTHLNTPGHQETGTVDSFFPVGPVAGDVSLTW